MGNDAVRYARSRHVTVAAADATAVVPDRAAAASAIALSRAAAIAGASAASAAAPDRPTAAPSASARPPIRAAADPAASATTSESAGAIRARQSIPWHTTIRTAELSESCDVGEGAYSRAVGLQAVAR